ncbi:MAG: helicase-related protein [Nitrososphaerota archaeon]|nr:helicase-related protein [Candidatus Calditenuaceae archaeon]MDW8073387.1 helicase-related protein [Nitrososphaerota archaeon]
MRSTGEILRELGYDFYTLVEEPVKPELTAVTLAQLVPGLGSSGLEIASKRLYRHQLEAFEALAGGKNLILRSGTGSGKTEAWFAYAASRGARVLAVYPTLALSNDQVNRLRMYCDALGLKASIIDAPTRTRIASSVGVRGLRKELASSSLVVTNPAFLLSEIKKLGSDRPPLLREFLSVLDLLVLDDIDFYSPRSLAILLAMCKILRAKASPRLRFAVLTAMLENPEELAAFLREISGRDVAIVEGKPFHPRNTCYVVLGRNLRVVWERVKERREAILRLNVGRDVVAALESYDAFLKNLYKVIEAAAATGLDLASLNPIPDPVEILASYVDDKGVTIAFTQSIARAEELRRRVAEIAGDEKVASHHHLIEKEARRSIEERARNGDLKLLISPRTLSQGIDIGNVVRIVHIGLPDSLREFLQKEGRKGRREEVEWTESVIIPSSSWDFNLLKRGTDALVKWLSMGREHVVVNPENKYITLVEALFKATRPGGVRELTPEESQLLTSLGMLRDYALTKVGKRAWMKLNFYEFAPSLGVKRIRRRRDGSERYLEDIAHVDLVERFQIGCIDYTSDGMVTRHARSPEAGRLVTSIIVEDISEQVLRRYESLAIALEEYEAVKRRWGEAPSIASDYYSGRFHTEVDCLVKPPEGFGIYVKLPNHVNWILRSGKMDIFVVDGKTVVSPKRRVIPVPTPTDGAYTDYTYGTLVETDLTDDPSMLRLGMALTEIVMRRRLGIPFETVKYDVIVVGDRKFVEIHEPESAGLIERIDWLELRRLVDEYVPDELDECLLEAINEMAYASLMSRGFDWRPAKHYASKILERLILRERLRLKLTLGEVVVPRPSRALKRCAVIGNYYALDESSSFLVYCIGVFDGETVRGSAGLKTPEGPDNSYIEASSIISGLIDEGFKILLYDYHQFLDMLDRMGMRSLKAKLLGAESLGLVEDVAERAEEALGERLPLSEACRVFGLEKGVQPIEVVARASKTDTTPSNPYWLRDALEKIGPEIEKVTADDLKSIYMLRLILEEVGSQVKSARASGEQFQREPP